MEYISIRHQCLVSSLAQCRPLGVLIIIVSDRVEFLFDDIDKRFQSGLYPEYFKLIPFMPLTLPVPLVFDMGEGFKE